MEDWLGLPFASVNGEALIMLFRLWPWKMRRHSERNQSIMDFFKTRVIRNYENWKGDVQ